VHGKEDLNSPEIGNQLVCELDELILIPGRYRMNAAIFSEGELQDHIEGAAIVEVEQGELRGRPVTAGTKYGNVCLQHRWTLPV
jgi:lipopolysaccharide transport system ATP-binding protein